MSLLRGVLHAAHEQLQQGSLFLRKVLSYPVSLAFPPDVFRPPGNCFQKEAVTPGLQGPQALCV